MHPAYTKQIIQRELDELALDDVVRPLLVRFEQRDLQVVFELPGRHYESTVTAGFRIPLLGSRHDRSWTLVADCTNYNTEPASYWFATSWDDLAPLSYDKWPKGKNIVPDHHKTHQPFVCTLGTREYHNHFQHEDDPWDRWRGTVRLVTVIRNIAQDLRTKDIF